MLVHDLIIIGAGPAGLFCAQRAASAGMDVLLLEKNTRPGRKLLVTGSGQCNITNTADPGKFLLSYGAHRNFVKAALRHFTPEDLQHFFLSRGLDLSEDSRGKIFPSTMRASDVLSVLEKACTQSGVTVHYATRVSSVQISGVTGDVQEPPLFTVYSTDIVFYSRFLVIATGGASWPKTGSCGDGYTLAASLGHNIVPPRPALAAIYASDYDCASCAGIAVRDCSVTLWRLGKKVAGHKGDVLFTHQGLSGPGILDFSRDICPGDRLTLCLTGHSDPDELDSLLVDLCRTAARRLVKNALNPLGVPESLLDAVLSRCAISADISASVLDRLSRRRIAVELCSFAFDVQDIEGFDTAMVTAGGVELSSVRARTMESQICPGLYFAGEVLDVDGDTGGYNLQFAFSSAALAADSCVAARTLADV